ncbi:hypothetical protein D3C86_1501670 [compost metagenome]
MIYFGPDTFCANIGMDLEGKVERCSAKRQLEQGTLRGKNEDLVRKEVHFKIIQKVERIGFRVVQHFPHFHDPLVQTIVVTRFFIFPVCCKTFFCNFIHPLGTDLYFYPLPFWPHHCSVQGFISVSFRRRYPIAQAVRIRAVKIGHDRIGFPAICFFIFGRTVQNDPDGKKIINFLKGDVLALHFIPYGMDGFGPAVNISN